MGKKKVEFTPWEDVKNNNWEIPEEAEGAGCQVSGASETSQVSEPVTADTEKPVTADTEKNRVSDVMHHTTDEALEAYCVPDYKPVEAREGLKEIFREITDGTVEAEELKRSIYYAWEKVDPAIRENNPVWKWSRNGDKFVFVFRDGRKVRVEL
ncbi:MAG: hypothetical protein IJI07_00640 [Flexilinea sp.]|nr:hypothetical protein [Flexilinea sp.]